MNNFFVFIMITLICGTCFAEISADINSDGIVDLDDFSIMSQQWLNENPLPTIPKLTMIEYEGNNIDGHIIYHNLGVMPSRITIYPRSPYVPVVWVRNTWSAEPSIAKSFDGASFYGSGITNVTATSFTVDTIPHINGNLEIYMVVIEYWPNEL